MLPTRELLYKSAQSFNKKKYKYKIIRKRYGNIYEKVQKIC